MAEKNIEPKSNRPFKRQQKSSLEHKRIPRQPRKPERGDNIIYVSSKTNIKALVDKCNKLINKNENELIIYCMGAAIQRGILLALQVCEDNISYSYAAQTLTTELIDDFEPTVDEADYDIQKRFNSALRIRIFNTHPIE